MILIDLYGCQGLMGNAYESARNFLEEWMLILTSKHKLGLQMILKPPSLPVVGVFDEGFIIGRYDVEAKVWMVTIDLHESIDLDSPYDMGVLLQRVLRADRMEHMTIERPL